MNAPPLGLYLDMGHLDMFSGDLLHLFGQRFYLGTVLLVCRSTVQRQQMTQRIDGRMHLGSLAPPGSVVASACARFGRGLDRAAVRNHCRRLFLTAGKLPQQLP
jgi:hypothetical protein